MEHMPDCQSDDPRGPSNPAAANRGATRAQWNLLVQHLGGALRDHDAVELTITEIEALIGVPLPRGAFLNHFWSSSRTAQRHWRGRGIGAAILPGRLAVRFSRGPAITASPPTYRALTRYLEQLPAEQDGVELSFAELERILGAPLPSRALLSRFWSHSETARRNWQRSGYSARLLPGQAAVRFTRQ